MRSTVKQFESVCQDQDELQWNTACCSASVVTTKHTLLVEAMQPFMEAARHIPEGTSPDETVYEVFPPLGLFVGDFYKLVNTLKKTK